MPILHPDYKILFLEQPRTGNRAVGQWLLQCGGRKVGQGRHHILGVDFEKYRKESIRVVSTVRNHWDYIISWYHFSRWSEGWKGTFEQFIEFLATRDDRFFKPGKFFWCYQPLSEIVMRYETLAEDFAHVLGRADPVDLPKVGLSVRKPYREYYDSYVANKVHDIWGDEIEDWGYEF
jgi:hypothetical protein